MVDNPDIYNRLAPRLKNYQKLKFVIVLWGSKSVTASNENEGQFPMYSYDELVGSGRTSRQALAAVTSSGI